MIVTANLLIALAFYLVHPNGLTASSQSLAPINVKSREPNVVDLGLSRDRSKHRYVDNPEDLARKRGAFRFPAERPDVQHPPVWTYETLNMTNEILFPAGVADERYVVNYSSWVSGKTRGAHGYLSLVEDTKRGPVKKWYAKLEVLPVKAEPKTGTLELWLASMGLQIANPELDVKRRLGERHAYAVYETDADGPGVTRVLFLATSGQLYYDRKDQTDILSIGNRNFKLLVTGLERRWLEASRVRSIKRATPRV